MYGLLLEAIVDYLKSKYGEDIWDRIRHVGKFNTPANFATHDIYSETLIPNIAKVASRLTGETEDYLMDSFGVSFVSFVGQYGYDRILKVLGRHMRDFLNGLDNLHEYLRFSYPRLEPPSFFCTEETEHGLKLHYRSKRRGFLHYVMGQIRQVGKLFYSTHVNISVQSQDEVDGKVYVVLDLEFDNTAYKESDGTEEEGVVNAIPFGSELLFDLFPFHIVFARDLNILSIGRGLAAIMHSARGSDLTKVFNLRRPLVDFTWQEILAHTNNVFEMRSVAPVTKRSRDWEKLYHLMTKNKELGAETMKAEPGCCLNLKGQMMYMKEWDAIMFLGTPVMESLDKMFDVGLYINDLSMHDSSRDLVLAGTQQSAELKLALDQEQAKSRLLEDSVQKLDAEMARTDALLYQMIPKSVADRLRRGEASVNTCEVFDSVTILFSDVVGFTTICSQITPMEVVCMLNAMYTKFDHLSEKHSVYKVETIGDAYMSVSGAPSVTPYHALHICDMALEMLDSMWDLKDPSTGSNMKIRVGIHTGTTVAGVVGIKMPRYCLFGDTVNTASRMETNGESQKIHISETTKKELEPYPYLVQERGKVELKGRGQILSYWLLGKDESQETAPTCPFTAYLQDEMRRLSKDSNMGDGDSLGRLSFCPMYSPVSFVDIPRSTFNTPVKSSTGSLKVSSVLNNHETNRTVVLVEPPCDSPKLNIESVGSNGRDKDVDMIKNTLNTNNDKNKALEKTKSRLCHIL